MQSYKFIFNLLVERLALAQNTSILRKSDPFKIPYYLPIKEFASKSRAVMSKVITSLGINPLICFKIVNALNPHSVEVPLITRELTTFHMPVICSHIAQMRI